MKFIPILFNTDMVLALLDGRKTQTRRTKGLNCINLSPNNFVFNAYGLKATPPLDFPKITSFYSFKNIVTNEIIDIDFPYEMHDVLWVRETFEIFGTTYNPHGNPFEEKSFLKIQFKADRRLSNEFSVENFKALNALVEIEMKKGTKSKFRPSIHMPKAAARLFLQITDIRIERLKEISETDAIAEGVKNDGFFEGLFNYKNYCNNVFDLKNAIDSFKSLWLKINGKQSLDLNPWVWVIEFEKIEKPINF
ncbi:hypothetical protein G6N05_05280 [Flavobacterium sp. F372]|uniref:Uncharacterized protein n=1 Tax=Flavobacterium bernardetii TaxID=2813823 RepID=A0ABR7J1D3_9FLAO|nr:hypothetical protein [Flavobacterium bernardetii]MBC5835792.1 hypothetical protein [Flavobacterium bernardetii]NHF69523.1 hypothetical protein [Flavobacterium bernardetii]